MIAPRILTCLVAILLTIIATTPKIDAEQTTTSSGKGRGAFELRDASIREALVSISTGKLPANDDRLISLITEHIGEVAFKANGPSAGIDAAARQAQEAVSEVTAAYTAVIFRSSSAVEAGRLFNRFNDTVNKIVEVAKSGNFIVRYNPAQKFANE